MNVLTRILINNEVIFYFIFVIERLYVFDIMHMI